MARAGAGKAPKGQPGTMGRSAAGKNGQHLAAAAGCQRHRGRPVARADAGPGCAASSEQTADRAKEGARLREGRNTVADSQRRNPLRRGVEEPQPNNSFQIESASPVDETQGEVSYFLDSV